MSDNDEDSSLQLERLISSLDTSTGSSIDKTGPDHQSQTPSLAIQDGLHSSPTVTDNAKSNKPLPDINQCYAWLQNGGQRDRKVSERSNSTESTASSSSTSSSSSSLSVSLPMPTPPDGGWGWMVVLGAFLVSFICDGLSYCFGVLYAELLSQFGESKSKTSLVGSIFFGVSMILGPFASAMTTRFGCRKVTIFGGLLSSFGFILSYFATSIDMLCITFSVIVGTGFSFCYITSVVIVAFYFKKRRSLATGLAVCGTGVGTFVFGPFMDYLISVYGWRGLFLIMAGISLNLIVCGMLFRPLKLSEAERCNLLLEEFEKIPHGRAILELKRVRNISECTETSCGTELDSFEEEPRTLSMMSLPTFASGKVYNASSDLLMEALKNSRNPHLTMQRYMKNALFRLNGQVFDGEDKDRLKCLTGPTLTTSINGSLDNTATLSGISLNTVKSDLKRDSKVTLDEVIVSPSMKSRSNTDNTPLVKKKQIKLIEKKISTRTKTGGSNFMDASENVISQSSKLPSFNVGRRWAYGIHLPLYRTDIFYRRWLRQNAKPCMLGTSCPELIESSENKPEGNYFQRTVKRFSCVLTDVFSDMLEFSLFSNGFFALFVVSNFLYYFWSDVPYMYAADHAMTYGASPRKASFIISVIGIFNTIGQVVFGFIGDMKVNLISLYAIVSVFAGVFVALVPVVTPVYWQACIFYALFGFCISVGYPLTTVLMVNYLGVEKLTSAYGLLMLMQGIANLFGPPFAGWISDETDTYDTSFYLSGVFYALSGLVMFFIYSRPCKSKLVEQELSVLSGGQETSDII